VLELGAQLSDTSSHICRTIGPQGKAVLVDVKRSDVKSGRCGVRNIDSFTSTIISGDSCKEEELFVDRVDFVELEQFDQ
jgi:hypothetical protein